MPDAVVVSASFAWTTMRSSSGLIATLVAVVTGIPSWGTGFVAGQWADQRQSASCHRAGPSSRVPVRLAFSARAGWPGRWHPQGESANRRLCRELALRQGECQHVGLATSRLTMAGWISTSSPPCVPPRGRPRSPRRPSVAGGDPLAAAAALRVARASPPALAAAALDPGRAAPPGGRQVRPGGGRDVPHPARAGAGHPAGGRRPAGRPARAPPGCAPSPTWAAASAPTRSPPPAPASGCTAVEADPVTAAMAAANAEAAGLAELFTVECGDATAFDVARVDAVFCDPARRQAGTGRRIFDPNAYSPPWDFVAGLAERVPHTVVKVAPGIDHALIPAGRRGGVGERRRRPGRGGPLVRRAGRGAPPRHPAARQRAPSSLDAGPRSSRGSGDVEAPVGPVAALPVRPGPGGGPRAPGRRAGRHARTRRWPTRASPTSTPTRRSRRRSPAAWRSPTCCRSR